MALKYIQDIFIIFLMYGLLAINLSILSLITWVMSFCYIAGTFSIQLSKAITAFLDNYFESN